MTWYRVCAHQGNSLRTVCGGVEVGERGIVVKAAPVWRWAVNKPYGVLVAFLKRRYKEVKIERLDEKQSSQK
jgi:hypothetical protein